jgi:hypothetical protein
LVYTVEGASKIHPQVQSGNQDSSPDALQAVRDSGFGARREVTTITASLQNLRARRLP